MPWWGWMTIGCFLLGAELLGVDAAFYLVFVGFAAVVTGLLGLLGIAMPGWAQWLVFAAIALTSMVLFRSRIYKRFRGAPPGYDNTLIGEVVELADELASGEQARVSLRGSQWTAVNIGDETIVTGRSGKVVESEGGLLKIKGIVENPGESGS